MSNKIWIRQLAIAAMAVLALSVGTTAAGVSAEGEGDKFPSIPEKRELKYPNLGSRLNDLVARVEEGAASAQEAADGAPVQREGSVAVTVYLSGNVADVAGFLEDNGGDPRNVGEDYIEAYVPMTLLGRLSEQPGVVRVREIVPPEPDFGNITSQGVPAHGAPAWHRAGNTGQGVKVGIIDAGFEGFGSLMGTELPTTVQARCYTEVGSYTSDLADCGNNTYHGTAVAENIMDIAPDVSLYIARYGSKGDFRDTVNWMISEGVSVINRSLGGSFEGPGDGTSPFSNSRLKTIDRAVDGRIIFLNSAGNNADVTWFQDSPPSIRDPDGDGDGFIEFAEGDTTNSIGRRAAGDPGPRLNEGHEIFAYLRWEDTWLGASTDLDIYLVDSTSGEIVERGEDGQSGLAGDVPTESLHTEIPRDGEYHIAVVYRGGNLPGWIQLTVPKAISLEHSTEGYSINGPSESANPGMLAVGATHYWDTNTIADYSSQGPALDDRIKPDIVGAACGRTASYEPNVRDGSRCWFSGTSSASPHVAGLAALVRQRFPDYTPQQVAQYLKDNAAQRETPDPNNTWGHGFAQLPSAQAPQTLREEEKAALVALYNATGGPNWTNNANWVSSQPVGLWHGATTDPSGRVVGLSLPENGLTGEIPSELGSLSNLIWLSLSSNQLTGEIPTELGGLSNLQELYLSDNQLTGEIPVELGSLTNLQELYLSDNQLTGEIPVELGSLTNLTELSLWGNQLSGEIPVELGDLASLTVLSLSSNQLTGEIPTELGSLTNLTELSLWGNQLSGEIPVELGDLASLTVLSLSSNQLTGEIPTELGSLTNLTELSLWGNQLSGEIPVELGDLASLTVLSLSSNQLTGEIPTELGSLTNLTELSLWGNQLSGEIPVELGDLASLTVLSLSSNQLTGEIPTELGSLTNLTELSLWGNQLSGEIPVELGDLASLTVLSLSSNQLTGEIPTELGSLTNLTELSLWGNQLSGEIPVELGDLASLQELYLLDNQLSGEIPVELGDLASLTVLSLSSNQLTGEIPTELGSLTNLTELSLWGNQLSGEIPVELGDLASLTVLSLSSNQLTGEIPTELGSLTNLTELSLWGNQLSGEIPVELGDLASLTVLSLSSNQLTGEIPTELGSLTNLTELSLWGNQLSGEIPVELGDLASLQELYLSDNQLTGEIPVELGSLTNLTELSLWGNQLSGEIPVELGDLASLTVLSLWGNQLTGEIPSELGDLSNLDVLYLSQNRLIGCIPSGLQGVTSNDFSELGLPFCEVGSAPEFPAEETGERSVAENTGAGIPIGDPVQATSSGATLIYSLGGTDAADFTIVSGTGQLMTKAALDYETKASYEVTVTATAPSGESATKSVAITVTDVDEAPVLTGNTTVSHAENGTGPVATYTAADPEGESLTWSLSGDDAGDFTITGGVLAFATAPDYETEADADTDNVYEVTVEVSDGTNSDSIDVTITVTDVDEAPVLSGSATVSYAENGTGPVATYTAIDPEGASLTWSLSGDDAADLTITGGVLAFAAAPDYETEADADTDNVYEVTMEVSDGTNTDMADVTITVTDVDEAPVLTGNTTVSYAENGTGPVATYTAIDPEGASLTWSLSGDDAADLTITGGVLAFAAAPDYETEADADTDNVYEVTMEVSDGTNTDMADVTITVTDVDEAPVLTGNTTVSYAENGTGPVATYTAIDPEGASLTWSLSGDDAADLTITGGVLAFVAAPDMDDPTDADTDNVYEVTVEVSDGTNTDMADVTITVTVAEDAPQTLLERYDADDSGSIEKSEVIHAINDYLFGEGANALSKEDVIEVINLYLFG